MGSSIIYKKVKQVNSRCCYQCDTKGYIARVCLQAVSLSCVPFWLCACSGCVPFWLCASLAVCLFWLCVFLAVCLPGCVPFWLCASLAVCLLLAVCLSGCVPLLAVCLSGCVPFWLCASLAVCLSWLCASAELCALLNCVFEIPAPRRREACLQHVRVDSINRHADGCVRYWMYQ
jgi:hypothetical protein